MQQRRVPVIKLPTTKAALWINGEMVTAKRQHMILKTYHSISLRQYFKESTSWSDANIEDIWWILIGKTLAKFSPGKASTITKFTYKRLPCNVKENRYYPYRSAKCSACKTEDENAYHVLQCKCHLRTMERTRYTKQLKSLLEEQKTDPVVTRAIMANVTAWLSNITPPVVQQITDNPSPTLLKAIQAQQEIGWDHFFKGRLSMHWAYMYNYILENTDHGLKHQTAEKWGEKIIEITWQFVLNCWNIRNGIEHDSDGDPIGMKKVKLCEKIIWQRDQLASYDIVLYKDSDYDTLVRLPIANLQMIERQMENLYKNRPKEDVHNEIISEYEAVGDIELGMHL
jgi:hypothetical protein